MRGKSPSQVRVRAKELKKSLTLQSERRNVPAKKKTRRGKTGALLYWGNNLRERGFSRERQNLEGGQGTGNNEVYKGGRWRGTRLRAEKGVAGENICIRKKGEMKRSGRRKGEHTKKP